MEVVNNKNRVNFKAIQLTSKEACRVGRALRQYKLGSNQEIKKQILDIFIPHIKKEVALATQKQEHLSIPDYTQKLYLKLFESIENITKNKNFSTGELVRQLNEVQPKEDDFVTMGHKSLEELSPDEEFLTCKQESQTLHQKMHKIFSKKLKRIPLRNREISLEFLDGVPVSEIAERMNLTRETIYQIIAKNASTIRYVNKKGEFIARREPDNTITVNLVNKKFADRIMEEEGY